MKLFFSSASKEKSEKLYKDELKEKYRNEKRDELEKEREREKRRERKEEKNNSNKEERHDRQYNRVSDIDDFNIFIQYHIVLPNLLNFERFTFFGA